jgi:glutamate decarboxylase
MQEPTRASIRSVLSKSTLFASLLPEELDHLASICTMRQLDARAVLFREGDPGDTMFVVVTGRVQVHVAGQDGDIVLSSFGPGEIFGEIAVLDGRGRTATATAVVASELLAISRQEFHTFLDAFPRYTNVLLHLMVARIRTTVQLFPRLDGLGVDFSSVGDTPVAASDPSTLAGTGRNARTSSLSWGASEIPEAGTSAVAIYRRIHDELQLDGQPHLNVASFVTTWMESEAEQLAYESINKNLINVTEYARTEAIHQQVIAMTARLFHADITAGEPKRGEQSGLIGTTTVGSSEAVMLALLAHKWNWKHKYDQSPQRSAKDRPYLIIGTHTHACFAKFARYFDVEVKWVRLQPGLYAITAEQVQTILETTIADDVQVMETCGYTPQEAGKRRVGELVMAVGCVVGTTYTGDIDDVEGIDRVLTQGGWDIPIHVDAASGGFILPFTQAEDTNALRWDFRLARVMSINVSNHKYGLVYPGLGTVVFRDATVVPEALLIDIDYLSGEMRNYSLNFSRASSSVILQYYNFLRLGKAGYRHVIQGCLVQAQYLANAIETSPTLQPYFEVISKTEHLPIVAVRLKDSWLDHPPFTLEELAQHLEAVGWFAPVYHLPPDNDQIEVVRIVIRAHFNRALARAFLHDLEAAVQQISMKSIYA